MCGGSKPAPQPSVDPVAERQKAADDAAKAANAATAATALRRRGQSGLLSSEQGSSSALAQAFGAGVGASIFGRLPNVLGSALNKGS